MFLGIMRIGLLIFVLFKLFPVFPVRPFPLFPVLSLTMSTAASVGVHCGPSMVSLVTACMSSAHNSHVTENKQCMQTLTCARTHIHTKSRACFRILLLRLLIWLLHSVHK